MPHPLEVELRYFDAKKGEWIGQSHSGHFALVKGEELHGTFSTFQQAFEAGVQLFGRDSFLVKQILDEEPLAIYPALQMGLVNAHL